MTDVIYGGVVVCSKHNESYNVSVGCRLCTLEDENKKLKEMLGWAYEELIGWCGGQGEYDIESYGEKLKKIKPLLEDKND